MTKEEAIAELKKGRPQQWDIHRDIKAFDEALNMAIKALQKDLILDKIRAEIKAIAINGQLDEQTIFMRAEEQLSKWHWKSSTSTRQI